MPSGEPEGFAALNLAGEQHRAGEVLDIDSAEAAKVTGCPGADFASTAFNANGDGHKKDLRWLGGVSKAGVRLRRAIGWAGAELFA